MKQDNLKLNKNQIILYTTANGDVKLKVFIQDETIWLTQKMMAELFGVEVHTINYHLKEIFNSGELGKSSTIRKIRIVQNEGKREVDRDVTFYNLDAIIAVGYRVNSKRATQFRIWATQVLKEYIIKGFVLNDERLKQGKRVFGKDYFQECGYVRDRLKNKRSVPYRLSMFRLLPTIRRGTPKATHSGLIAQF